MATELAGQVVDAMNAIGGVHAGARAAHAKGTLCAATFTPTPEAADLSRAEHFQGGPVRAHIRFSNGGGDPNGPDFEPRDGRGMGTKFYLSGATTDIVAVTLPAFFVRTPEDFHAFVVARRPDPATGEPDMEAMGKFLADHPEAMTAIEAVLLATPPESYLRCAYNALHSYRFVAADGTARFGRYRWDPELGEATLSAEDAQQRGPDYLRQDLGERLAQGPAAFSLTVTLAGDGDPVDDATAVWPSDRQRVTVGRLEITGLASDRERDGDVLVFDPTRVTDGIELSGDEILRFREHAYAESVLRRTGVAHG